VFARKLVNSPCSLPVSSRGRDDFFRLLLQFFQAAVAAVFDHELEPAGRAEPFDRRRAEHIDCGVADLLLHGRLQPRCDGVARQARLRAIAEIVEHQIYGAEVRRVGVQQNRLARDRHCILHPFGLQRDVVDLLHHHLGALHGRGVGQLHVHQQVAFVLQRNEAARSLLETPIGRVEQAAVEQQHDQAHSQRPTNDAGVDRRREIERLVEGPERYAQHAIQ